MAKIRWSNDSIENLKKICEFIEVDSSVYSQLFIERLFEIIEHLETFPLLGRRVPESDDPNVRELIYRDYRIIYQVQGDFLEIISIIHGSKLLKI
ncbi:MAG: type II toxin-antitoxin system RelE/ParE family toxin [bacterium]|nr:type II toxin-antitoxin system RelE/ParE family toxin [bacterium]